MENIIFYFLCFLVEAVILWQYASQLFIPKRALMGRLILLVSLYTILFMVSFFDIKWLNMGLYILANFFFLFSQYTLPLHFAIFHSIILAAIMGMSELIIYSILEHFTPHFFAQAEYFHNKLLFIILSKILFYFVAYIQIHFLKKKQNPLEHYDNSALILVFVPSATIFTMLTFVNISDSSSLTQSQTWMISFTSLFLLASNLFIFAINQHNQEKYEEYTEMQLLLQKETDSAEYFKMLLVQNENQKILIHDIKKHLHSIEILNEQGNAEKVNKYIHQLMNSSDLKEISRICDHELLNAILSRYKRQCNEKQIKYYADIRKGTTDFIADNDLTSIFCNLLDNAFEAAINTHEPFIEISTAKRENTSLITIIVINSCRTSPFSDVNARLITTKSDKTQHGYGIKSISKITHKYHGDIQMYFNSENLTFHTILTLKSS